MESEYRRRKRLKAVEDVKRRNGSETRATGDRKSVPGPANRYNTI